MADISDVEQALENTITSILYPAGFVQSSIIGALCRVYRGWPNSATLNADLNAGAVNVTVVTDNDSGRTTTRYLPRWQTVSAQPGVAAHASGPTIIISGSPAAGDVVGALIDGKSYVCRVRAGDAPDLVASNLDQLIKATRFSNVQGSTIPIQGSASIKVRVVRDSSTSFESRRQGKDLRIICWCPTPLVRDSVASVMDAAIDQIEFLSLGDGTSARIVYHNTSSYDQAQNALLYRRDLIYKIEYPTIFTIQEPSMLFGASDLNGNVTYG